MIPNQQKRVSEAIDQIREMDLTPEEVRSMFKRHSKLDTTASRIIAAASWTVMLQNCTSNAERRRLTAQFSTEKGEISELG